MEHFGRNFKIMKITKIKLKSLIEANLAIYGEDRVVGRFLKDTFRKLGGQKKENWKNTRFIYWLHAKPIESILKGTIPGEIGVRAYHKDQVVGLELNHHTLRRTFFLLNHLLLIVRHI